MDRRKLMETLLVEDKVVKFNGETYPDFGWCVILCGAPGSGKSTAYKNLVPINAKKFDVDDIKSYVIKTSEFDGDYLVTKNGNVYDLSEVGEPYDLTNPKFTSLIHQVSKGLSKKFKDSVLSMGKHSESGRLPNIVFDATGSEIHDFTQIINAVKPMGYKVAIVWVLADIEQSLKQNEKRKRRVPQDLIFGKAMEVLYTMSKVTSDKELFSQVDDFWVIIQMEFDLATAEGKQSYVKEDNVFKVEKKEGVAYIRGKVADMIDKQQEKLDSLRSGADIS